MTEHVGPIVAVGAFIFNEEGKLFLATSHKWNGDYMVPGGKVDKGETLEEAVTREIREETGMQITDVTFLNLLENVYDKQFWKPNHFIFLNFTCKTDSTQVQLNNEMQEYVWVTLEEALKLKLNSYTRKTIELLI